MSVAMTYEHAGVTYSAEIAKVKETHLGAEDHGVFTAYLSLDFGGSGQSVGGYAFDAPVYSGGDEPEFLGRWGTDFGMEWIKRCMEACGVRLWEQIPGRTILALRPEGSHMGRIIGIAPLPSEKGSVFIFNELGDAVDQDGRLVRPDRQEVSA